jgi:hypothetical protein
MVGGRAADGYFVLAVVLTPFCRFWYGTFLFVPEQFGFGFVRVSPA